MKNKLLKSVAWEIDWFCDHIDPDSVSPELVEQIDTAEDEPEAMRTPEMKRLFDDLRTLREAYQGVVKAHSK